jgi:hypothetical protein
MDVALHEHVDVVEEMLKDEYECNPNIIDNT